MRIAFIVHGPCPPAVEELAVALMRARHCVQVMSDAPFEGFGRRSDGVERVIVSRLESDATWKLRDWSPDVVHAFGFRAGIAAHLAMGNKVPIVQSLGGLAATQRRLGAFSPEVSAQMLVERRIMDRSAMVVADGAEQAIEILRCGVIAARVVTVTPGVDWHRYPVTPLPRRSAQRPWCLFAPGGSGPDSGIDDIMAAISAMPNVHLSVAGVDEGAAATIRTNARRWRVQDRLALHGQLPASSIPGMYVSADAVILAPRQSSSGRLALEALSSGRPVIATSCGGIVDVVEDDVTGFLAPPRDPASLALAVRRAMMTSRSRLDEMALESVTRVRQDHSWTQRLSALNSVYESVSTTYVRGSAQGESSAWQSLVSA